jgi:hypothetical protein
MEMETVGKILLVTAAALTVIGVVLLIAGRLGLGRLPGDILIHRDGLTIFIPLGSMLALSVVGSLLLTCCNASIELPGESTACIDLRRGGDVAFTRWRVKDGPGCRPGGTPGERRSRGDALAPPPPVAARDAGDSARRQHAGGDAEPDRRPADAVIGGRRRRDGRL